MSDQQPIELSPGPNGYPQSPFNPANPVNWYAFVIDGEVVWMQTVQKTLEFLNIVMQSKPEIVQVPEHLEGEVLSGWTYDGVEFHEPTI
jgi:hypothetical protein